MGRYYKCVGYKRDERYFTKGKIYKVGDDGYISNDKGYCYSAPFDLDHWLAINFYDFVEVKGEENMERKFNVGDKVRCINKNFDSCGIKYGSVVKVLANFAPVFGRDETKPAYYVEAIDEDNGDAMYADREINQPCMDVWEKDFELVEDKKSDFNPIFSQIHIKSDGYRTIAKMKNKSEEVKCHPDDTFEYAEGCVRAIERLFDCEGRWTGKDEEVCEETNNKPKQPKEGEYIENRRVKIVDVSPHSDEDKYVCLNEYIGKTGVISGRYSNEFYRLEPMDFDEDYMNAIDERNGQLCYKGFQVEFLD